ncbi:MAG TPA: hypothetical protein VM847_12415, partial [Tahibacter sp.]|nr:hypothetical protein [Tahibacter sp.]
MALTAAQKKLFAEPDGKIVWDAYMRKREADIAAIEVAQLANFGPDTPLDQLLDPAIMQRNAIPALFRYDTRTRTKTNLLVFLKPTVIRTSADGRAIT